MAAGIAFLPRISLSHRLRTPHCLFFRVMTTRTRPLEPPDPWPSGRGPPPTGIPSFFQFARGRVSICPPVYGPGDEPRSIELRGLCTAVFFGEVAQYHLRAGRTFPLHFFPAFRMDLLAYSSIARHWSQDPEAEYEFPSIDCRGGIEMGRLPPPPRELFAHWTGAESAFQSLDRAWRDCRSPSDLPPPSPSPLLDSLADPPRLPPLRGMRPVVR